MTYGITTARAHLNKLSQEMLYEDDSVLAEDGQPAISFARELENLDPDHGRTKSDRELNWIRYSTRTDMPAFAGRYFLGHATAEEIAGEESFCIWAHGEGVGPDIPASIFPIQRANARWQGVTNRADARVLARMEATGFLNHVAGALRVGDLFLPAYSSPAIVYLETAPGRLSAEYWRYWARTVRNFGFPDPVTGGRIMPFVPGLICDFEETEAGSLQFWPEQAVRDALGKLFLDDGDEGAEDEDTGSRRQPACESLWARKIPSGLSLAPVFSKRWFGSTREAPTHITRVWDCATEDVAGDDPDLSPGEIATLKLITFDVSLNREDTNALDWALQVNAAYRINAPTAAGVYNADGNFAVTDASTAPELLPTPPDQIGLDHLSAETQARYALARQTEVEIRYLPDSHFSNWTPPVGGTVLTGDPIVARPSFTGRYLPPRSGSHLTADEARQIAAGDMQVVSLYQQHADPLGTNRSEFEMSDSSMREAFENAMAFGQPPFTPVYFAIDVDVDGNNWKEEEWRTDPDGTVHKAGPSFRDVLGFYRRIRHVYAEQYITQDGAVPYYIGAYAPVKVLHALYRAGLATHFWQSMSHTFGRPVGMTTGAQGDRWYWLSPGWRAWPHVNLWQIRLATVWPDGATGFWDWPRNKVLADPPFRQDAQAPSWCDINVAWGDPGGWVPEATEMPVLPPDPADGGEAGA